MRLKTIPNFPAYCVSKTGKVWSKSKKTRSKGGFLKPILYNGYFRISLYKNLRTYREYIHRLVLETFVGPCPEGMECCHNNGIRIDNRLENLRWDTRKNNVKDAIKHGTHSGLHQKGETHPKAKLKEKDVRIIIYMHRTGLFLMREIAEIYNIGYMTVNSIINRKNWKHIWKI